MLTGIKVIEIARVLAGPLCGMILGDLGADVIKVERPGTGDETRGWGPPFDRLGRSAYFLSINRNKLSLAADFDNPRDVAIVHGLIAEADVVIDNFRGVALARRGLAPDVLVAAHPRLIWCTISGFGLTSDRPGYDFVVQAESGWMAITGEPLGEPMKTGVALTDVITGKDAAVAVLAALVARASTGRGRHVAVSLASSATAALVNVAQNALVTGVDAGRWGNAHPSLVPYQLFHAADRALVVAVGSDRQWVACARALRLERLAADPLLASNAGRVAQRAGGRRDAGADRRTRGSPLARPACQGRSTERCRAHRARSSRAGTHGFSAHGHAVKRRGASPPNAARPGRTRGGDPTPRVGGVPELGKPPLPPDCQCRLVGVTLAVGSGTGVAPCSKRGKCVTLSS